jgi:hypothetical protein
LSENRGAKIETIFQLAKVLNILLLIFLPEDFIFCFGELAKPGFCMGRFTFQIIQSLKNGSGG